MPLRDTTYTFQCRSRVWLGHAIPPRSLALSFSTIQCRCPAERNANWLCLCFSQLCSDAPHLRFDRNFNTIHRLCFDLPCDAAHRPCLDRLSMPFSTYALTGFGIPFNADAVPQSVALSSAVAVLCGAFRAMPMLSSALRNPCAAQRYSAMPLLPEICLAGASLTSLCSDVLCSTDAQPRPHDTPYHPVRLCP